MPKLIDLTGDKYGKLTVIRRNGHLRGKTAWLCKCDCGNEITVDSNSLRTGNTRSCGCLVRKTGKTKDRVYFVWQRMMARCYNPKIERYPNYGGRGITVCNEWHDFFKFKEWAYKTGYDPLAPIFQCTLDRVDVNGNYCPENCRWATAKEQGQNTTRSHRITVHGEQMTISEASEKYGVPMATIWWRVSRGNWDETEAATTLPNKGARHYG